MEQTYERTADLAFERDRETTPASMKQFLFGPMPPGGVNIPLPEAPPSVPDADLNAIVEDVVNEAQPSDLGPMPSSAPPNQPAVPEPEYVFQFESAPAAKTSFSTSVQQPRDAEDLPNPLPDFAAAYFQQMLSQFEVFPVRSKDSAACLNFNPQATAVISHLSTKFDAQALALEDLGRMELALLSVMPARALPGHGRALYARYREATGHNFPGESQAAELPAETLRAELLSLLNELQQRGHLLPEISRQRTQISHACVSWITGLGFLGIFAAGISLFQPVSHEAEPLVLLLAALGSGAIGGFTRLLMKTQQTRPDITLEQALAGQSSAGSPFFLPVLGAVFAAVLFFLFAAFLSPAFFSVTLTGTSRLLLCSFAAGLLPDFLSRLRRTPAEKNSAVLEPAGSSGTGTVSAGLLPHQSRCATED